MSHRNVQPGGSGTRRQRKGHTRSTPSDSRYHGFPTAYPSGFIEEQGLFAWYDQVLTLHNRLAIVGRDGLGKTRVASEYAHRLCQSSKTRAFYLKASSENELIESLRSRFEELRRSTAGRSSQGHQFLLDTLKKYRPWILVVDDCTLEVTQSSTNQSSARRSFLSRLPTSIDERVIMVTNDARVPRGIFPSASRLLQDPLRRADAWRLFVSQTRHAETLRDYRVDISILQGYPLHILQFAHVVNHYMDHYNNIPRCQDLADSVRRMEDELAQISTGANPQIGLPHPDLMRPPQAAIEETLIRIRKSERELYILRHSQRQPVQPASSVSPRYAITKERTFGEHVNTLECSQIVTINRDENEPITISLEPMAALIIQRCARQMLGSNVRDRTIKCHVNWLYDGIITYRKPDFLRHMWKHIQEDLLEILPPSFPKHKWLAVISTLTVVFDRLGDQASLKRLYGLIRRNFVDTVQSHNIMTELAIAYFLANDTTRAEEFLRSASLYQQIGLLEDLATLRRAYVLGEIPAPNLSGGIGRQFMSRVRSAYTKTSSLFSANSETRAQECTEEIDPSNIDRLDYRTYRNYGDSLNSDRETPSSGCSVESEPPPPLKHRHKSTLPNVDPFVEPVELEPIELPYRAPNPSRGEGSSNARGQRRAEGPYITDYQYF